MRAKPKPRRPSRKGIKLTSHKGGRSVPMNAWRATPQAAARLERLRAQWGADARHPLSYPDALNRLLTDATAADDLVVDYRQEKNWMGIQMGAAIAWQIDGDDVADILTRAGLHWTTATLDEMHAAIRAHVGEAEWRQGMGELERYPL